MLLAAIDERHRGTYDFIYLPIDFKASAFPLQQANFFCGAGIDGALLNVLIYFGF